MSVNVLTLLSGSVASSFPNCSLSFKNITRQILADGKIILSFSLQIQTPEGEGQIIPIFDYFELVEKQTDQLQQAINEIRKKLNVLDDIQGAEKQYIILAHKKNDLLDTLLFILTQTNIMKHKLRNMEEEDNNIQNFLPETQNIIKYILSKTNFILEIFDGLKKISIIEEEPEQEDDSDTESTTSTESDEDAPECKKCKSKIMKNHGFKYIEKDDTYLHSICSDEEEKIKERFLTGTNYRIQYGDTIILNPSLTDFIDNFDHYEQNECRDYGGTEGDFIDNLEQYLYNDYETYKDIQKNIIPYLFKRLIKGSFDSDKAPVCYDNLIKRIKKRVFNAVSSMPYYKNNYEAFTSNSRIFWNKTVRKIVAARLYNHYLEHMKQELIE